MQTHVTLVSRNVKVGPIPVSTTSAKSCPTACPFNHANKGGCYAESGPLKLHWDKVTRGERGESFESFLSVVRRFAKGQLWRHNQAGDLVGDGVNIDSAALSALASANKGKRGFTYTHYSLAIRDNLMAVKEAISKGFTVNASANNLSHADELADFGVPVAVVLPSDVTQSTTTPKGRKVAICPAVLSDTVTCASCGLCAMADRKAIIGFPSHGTSKRKASEIASMF